MKIFHCGHCDQLIFFENVTCVNCGHLLAYLQDVADVTSLEPIGDELWRTSSDKKGKRRYRLCRNYREFNVCNWAIPSDDSSVYCHSCRLTRIIPNLENLADREAWARLETAKRRVIHSLLGLNLPVVSKAEDPEHGLAFEFLADLNPGAPGAAPILTGHENGVITINVAEADDAEREKRRLQLHEPYRTILGHFRHEVGHYYWDRLVRESSWIDGFRQQFGDERTDYGEALKRHHEQGAPLDWSVSFVSAYASAHPWEDWAETWAHYLHIHDTLETAIACGLSLRPKRSNEPAMKPDIALTGRRPPSFDGIIERWFSLTYVLNNLNRGMGLADAYPFVLSPPAVEKLRFVHDVVYRDPPSAANSSAKPQPSECVAP
jgi:hypothetical protein